LPDCISGERHCALSDDAILHQPTACPDSIPPWSVPSHVKGMASTNKNLAQSDKSPTRAEATKKRRRRRSVIWCAGQVTRPSVCRRQQVDLLIRFKSNEKLQAEALGILTEMIRRNLLTASVYISDPACVFSCNILDAYLTGSRSVTRKEIWNSYMTGVMPKRKGGPGITLTINQQFRLPPKDEAEVRVQLVSSDYDPRIRASDLLDQ
jgi:hypothetical protein